MLWGSKSNRTCPAMPLPQDTARWHQAMLAKVAETKFKGRNRLGMESGQSLYLETHFITLLAHLVPVFIDC